MTTDDPVAALAAALAGAVRANHTPSEWAEDAIDLMHASGWAVTRAGEDSGDFMSLRTAAIEVVIEATSDGFDPTTCEWGELIEQLEHCATVPVPAVPAPPREVLDARKALSAFAAEVDVAHGWGPARGRSHTPCGICRALERARAALGEEAT